MLSSISEFPREQFINCIRGKGAGFEPFLKQVKSLNTQWIYEATKHLYNTLFESKQSPEIKVGALKLCKQLLETCEIPCITLFQVYLLPLIYEIAIYKPQQTGPDRGNRFFLENGYSQRIQRIQEHGIEFVGICTEMLFVWSLVKKKRTLLNQQLKQDSEFVEFYNKFKKYSIAGAPSIPADLKYYKKKDPAALTEKYKNKLNNFEPISEHYCSFFVRKMVQSLQTEHNILFAAANKTISSLSNDLDMKKFLKYGDAYITSTLIQEIIDGLLSSENFIVKKNYLSLFSDLIKWADVEAILQLNYDDFIEQIAQNIAKVKGEKGISEGENIYPEFKGQKQAKKKFYLEFLKSLQIWSKLLQKDPLGDGEASKAEQLYMYFKIQRNFVFPENLMLKRLEQDYIKCMAYNEEKNDKILEKLRDDESSLINNKKSNSIHRKKNNNSTTKKKKEKEESTAPKPQKKITLESIKETMDDAIQDFVTLCDEDNKISEKMIKLIDFKDNFDENLEQIDEEDEPDEDELMAVLDDGDALIVNIDAIVPLFEDFKAKKISLSKFKELFQLKLQQLEDQENSQEEPSMSDQNRTTQSSKSGKDNMILNSLNQNGAGDTLENSLNESVSKKKFGIKLNDKEEPVGNKIIEKIDTHSNMSSKSIGGKKSIRLTNAHKSPKTPQTQQIKEKIENELLQNHSDKSKIEIKDKISRLQNSSIHSTSKKSQISEKIRSIRKSKIKPNQEQQVEKQVQQVNDDYYNYYTPQNNQKQKINAKKSIMEKVSQHRSNRGDVSITSRLSNSFSQHNKSVRSVGRKKVQSKIQQDTVKNQDDQRNLVHDYGSPTDFILNTPEENLQAKKLESSPAQREQKNSKIRQIHSISHNKSQIRETGHMRNENRVSSISRRSGSSIRSNRSRNHSRIFKKEREGLQKGGVSSIIKNQRKQVGQAYNMKMNYESTNKAQNEQPLQQNKPKQSLKYQTMEEDRYYNKNSQNAKKISKVEKNVPSSQKQIEEKNTFAHQFLLMNNDDDSGQEIDNYRIRPDAESPIEEITKKSDYGIEQIQSRARLIKKVQNRPEPTVKEVRPFTTRNLPSGSSYDRMPSRRMKGSVIHGNGQNKPQQQYLMMRLKKEQSRERDNELRAMQDKIFRLKSESSRLRSELSSRSNKNKEYSVGRRSSSNSSQDFQDFRRSHSSSRSSLKRKGSLASMSKNSMTSLEGRLANGNPFSKYFDDIRHDSTKKTLLRNKTLLLKNSELEIGCLFRKDKEIVKIMLYITPEKNLNNLSYRIEKDNNISVRSYPQNYLHIPEKKQVKITVALNANYFPFYFPKITLDYYTADSLEKKNASFIIPCPVHRFLDFIPPNNSKEFEKSFEMNEQKIIKIGEFMVNRKVGKLELLKEYFNGLSLLRKDDNVIKYGATCKNGKQSFSLLIFTRGSSYMAMQGIPHSKPEFLEFFMSSVKQIFQAIY